MKVSIVGLGLIGGSLAKALRNEYQGDIEIYALDTNLASIEQAKKEHIIDKGYTSFSKELFPCSVLFLCTYVNKNLSILEEIEQSINSSCILTDVTSVKTKIHQSIQNTMLEKHFIGGHPMTGSEKKNYENSSKLLFENSYYILTPTETVPEKSVEFLKNMIQRIHAMPLIMDYKIHDYSVAGISHFPHVLSALLVNTVRNNDSSSHFMSKIAAGGFKDITRISSSSPAMWKAISLENKENILLFLQDFQKELDVLKKSLLENEELQIEEMYTTAKNYRDSLTDSRYTSGSTYHIIHVDVPDVPGVLASVASLLAKNTISIKNIGIIHNREFIEGALQIEFYSKKESENAIRILKENNYTLFI